MKDKVIVIVGPTASGKSGLGIELAKNINGVVISADSMQIYKTLDIGTAKVTKEEADGIAHELIDIVDIDKKFSVSEYKELCYQKIEQILKQNKVPIIVGGTGLYINAVVNNMQFENFDEDLEQEIDEKIAKLTQLKSSEELYEMLYKLDEQAAKKIGKGNDKRIIRAIKLSMLGVKKSWIDEKNDLWTKNDSKYNFLVIYIDMPRDLLYDRINNRVEEMVKLGVVKEAEGLHAFKNTDYTAVQAIGYKEFFPYLEGEKTLEECVEVLKQKSRNYAKRQITWFKKLQDKIILDGTKSKQKMIEEILVKYNGDEK